MQCIFHLLFINNLPFRFPGASKVIDVIDVAKQADSKMKLGEFIRYFHMPERPKVLNLISLEFSDSKYVCVETTSFALTVKLYRSAMHKLINSSIM